MFLKILKTGVFFFILRVFFIFEFKFLLSAFILISNLFDNIVSIIFFLITFKIQIISIEELPHISLIEQEIDIEGGTIVLLLLVISLGSL